MTVSPVRSPTDGDERPEPPFSPLLVEELLRALTKAMRAHQLYLHNNPSYLRAVEVARAAFARVWEESDELRLDVTETELRWEGRAVWYEAEKAGDSLPWICFKDGVRELRFTRGFEHDELIPLLDILQRVRQSSPDEDDLLTLLWEQELVHLRYRYVEVSSEIAPALERAGSLEATVTEPLDGTTVAAAELPSGVVDIDSFDGTLYFLDEQEIAYLHEEVQKEYETDLRSDVVAMLLDTFEAQVDGAVRDEIQSVLDGLLLHFLAAGELSAVAYLLREAAVSAERARDRTPEQRAALASLPDRMSDGEVLTHVLQALDDAPDQPSPQALESLMQQLRASALATVLGSVRRVRSPKLRAALGAAADRLAAAHPSELVRLLQSDERDVVREAIERAAVLRTTAAVPGLARLVAEDDLGMRLAIVHALSSIGSPGAVQILERTVDDPHRDVRVATARALAQRGTRSALPKLEAAVKGRALRTADLTEKMAVFDAYGALCGDGGVPLLDGLLNERGLLGRREDPELRACAAMALGRIGTEAALTALRRAAGDQNIVVRSAVNRAIRGTE